MTTQRTERKGGREAKDGRRVPSVKEPDRNQSGLATGIAAMLKCTGVTAKDRIVVITDKETLKIGEMIRDDALLLGAEVGFIMMEGLGERPLTSLPDATADMIRDINPTVSFFAATTKDGELGFRKPLMGMLVGEFKVRHAHMPTVDVAVASSEAMCADYQEVARVTDKVHEIVKNAKGIRVTTPEGTDITVDLDPENLHWDPCRGLLLEQGDASNLPEGEVFTTPEKIGGKFVTTLLGDHFSEKYGVLETPVTVTIEDGYATSVSCENKQIEAELWEYLKRGENTDRVGEFAIGTNTNITHFIGNMLADEKAAGVHIAFGDPLGAYTGATWVANPVQHCDMVTQGCTIEVDGKTIMKEGKFTF